MLLLLGEELRQSKDRRKKASYREELKRQMQETIANKERLVFDTTAQTEFTIFSEYISLYCSCSNPSQQCIQISNRTSD